MALVSPLLPVDEALAAILARAEPLPLERVPLAEAAGRVLAEPAGSLVDLPPFPSSSMDGFAVRAADTPGRLPVVGKVAAGRPGDAAALRRARRWTSRPAASSRRAPMRSSRSSASTSAATRSRSRSPSPVRTSATAGGDVARRRRRRRVRARG